jgi:hypothetical protein
MPSRCIFLRESGYQSAPDITNDTDSADEGEKRDKNGRTAKGRGKMRATEGKVPLSKSKPKRGSYEDVEDNEDDEDDKNYRAAVAESLSTHVAESHQNWSSSSSSASGASKLPAADDKVPPRKESKPAGMSQEEYDEVMADIAKDKEAKAKQEASPHQSGSSSSAGASAANNQIGRRSIGNSHAGETEPDGPEDYEYGYKQEDDEGYGGVEEEGEGYGGGRVEYGHEGYADDEEEDGGDDNARFGGDDDAVEIDSGYSSSRHSPSSNRQQNQQDAVNGLASEMEMVRIGSQEESRGRRAHRSNGEDVRRSIDEVEGEEDALVDPNEQLSGGRERARAVSRENLVNGLALQMAETDITSQDTS